MFTEDPTVFLADFGLPVVAGAVEGLGILDMPTQIVAGDMVLTTEYSVRVEAAKFGGLHYGDGISVDGVNYQVREVHRVDDGIFVEVLLSKLAPEATAPGGQPRQFGLADLADVELNDPQPGDLLVNDGEKWTNGADDVGLAAGIALS
jgi:hypothetical protein